MDKKMAREIVESLPSLYPSMRAEEEEAIWAVLENDSAERLDTLIKALKSEHKKLQEMQKAQHEQRWIPCSEKLPEGFMPYYATCKSKIDNRENWVIEGMYAPYFGWEEPPMVMCGDAEIIAWMPKELPEPWEGDAE